MTVAPSVRLPERRFALRLSALAAAAMIVPTVDGHANGADDKSTLALPTVGANAVIDLVYMGGSDCPPCTVWKAIDYPKLQAMPSFEHLRFTEVPKFIQGAVPPAFFLPEHLKPMRDELVRTIVRTRGSPMFALMVDGKGVMGGLGTSKYDAMVPVFTALVEQKRRAMGK